MYKHTLSNSSILQPFHVLKQLLRQEVLKKANTRTKFKDKCKHLAK